MESARNPWAFPTLPLTLESVGDIRKSMVKSHENFQPNNQRISDVLFRVTWDILG